MHLLRPSSRPRAARLRTSLLVPLVALALVAPACSSVTEEAAATVEGTEITQDSLDAELDAMESDESYLASVEQAFGAPLRGAGEGTYDSRFMARLLSLRVYYELLDQELERRDIALTDADLEAVRADAAEAVGGSEVFESFPAAYRDRLVRQRALITKLGEAVMSEAVEEGAAQEYYEENTDQFESRCLAHILVGTDDPEQPTGERSRAEAATRAAELRAELEAGADFTELASSDANDDTVSAAQGGSLDCVTRETQFDPTFLEAAFAAEVGEVTEPVETQFGFHLILVSSADVPPFEEVRGQIEQQLAGGAGGFDEVLRTATCESEVDVASRYGSWDTAPCAEGSFASVVPPEGPATTTTALAPGPGGAAGGGPAGSDTGG